MQMLPNVDIRINGHDVTNRKRVPTSNYPMSKLKALQNATSRADLADILEVELKYLTFVAYVLKDDEKYTTFEIPKKTGGKRIISAPNANLKILQQKLALVLSACRDELDNINKSPAHGYVKGRSIITNANHHINKKFVLNIDLKDFFPSITFPRIYGFFLKNESFKLHDKVASTIAHIACFNGSLPQGSPCSPIISNLITNVLDVRLSNLAKKNKFKYSRYADDLTFSTRRKNTNNEIFTLTDNQASISNKLINTIEKCSFNINQDKTRLLFSTSHQEVTGLTVNKKINTPTTYWRKVRAMTYNLFTTGSYEVDGMPGTISQLRGRLGYINHIDMKNSHLREKGLGLNNRERTYRDFLFYIKFFANEKPTILCEGKTDHIYLHSALKSLYLQYPELAVKDESDNIRLNFDFFKYKHTESLLLDLTGGSDLLKKFIANYQSNTKKFKSDITKSPVIVFIDNDSGAKEIYALLKNKLNSPAPIDGTAPFYCLYNKIYIIPTPKIATKDSMIEDFFDKATLSTIFKGKKFQPDEKKFDEKINYSKAIFAEQIIAPNYKNIDFTNFSQIFDNIKSAILKASL